MAPPLPRSPEQFADAPSGGRVVHLRDLSASGWKHVALRVWGEISRDRLGMVSAGVAFYAFIAVFPALSALLSVWGLFADPATVQAQLANLPAALPEAARELINTAALRLAGSDETGLGFGALVSLLLTLWSANRGMKGLIQGVCIAYDEDEDERGVLMHNGLALLLTLGGVLLANMVIGLLVVLPPALERFVASDVVRVLANWLRWPILALFVGVGLAVVYRVAPPRYNPPWAWVTPGSVVATVLWLIGSAAFSYYVSNFSSYHEMYGSVSAVAISLIWFSLSAFTVLLGAEVNSEAERQKAIESGGVWPPRERRSEVSSPSRLD